MDHSPLIKAGRKALAAWLRRAEAHGTIYYVVSHVSRSGMSRNIEIATIIVRKRKPDLVKLWPHVDEADLPAGTDYSAALDVIARDWGFSFRNNQRCFVISGCGMDMVFALVDNLAAKAGLPRGYANRVRRDAF